MGQFNPLLRKCIKCGAEISYSKGDWKQGKIPDRPICGLCASKSDTKYGRMDDEIKIESKPFGEDSVIGKLRGRPRSL